MEQLNSGAQVVLLIPAREPDDKLLGLLRALRALWTGPVLLVDDGSSETAKATVFPAAEALGCAVVHHDVNHGKGRALKTGFSYCLAHWPDAAGVVTADCDGQHTPEDICAVRDRLLAEPGALVLGCRGFDRDVPFRSKAGNAITRGVMRVLCGVKVSDTQTGLRGVPASLLADLLDVQGERYEFETNMLLHAKERRVPFAEVPIATVYIDNNRSSYFNAVKDSFRIYKLLFRHFFRFCAASAAGFLVDIGAFTLFNWLLHAAGVGLVSVPIATAAARVLSAAVNFTLNHLLVFQSRKPAKRTAVRYAILCVCQLAASAGLVTLFSALTGGNESVIKIIVDVCLFFISYRIQKNLVF